MPGKYHNTQKALECIEAMKGYGTYRGEKIGVVRRDFGGSCVDYKKGDVILFSKSHYDKGTVTAEIPMTKEAIAEQHSKGSHLTTVCPIVSVPEHFVDEVRFPKIRSLLEKICLG